MCIRDRYIVKRTHTTWKLSASFFENWKYCTMGFIYSTNFHNFVNSNLLIIMNDLFNHFDIAIVLWSERSTFLFFNSIRNMDVLKVASVLIGHSTIQTSPVHIATAYCKRSLQVSPSSGLRKCITSCIHFMVHSLRIVYTHFISGFEHNWKLVVMKQYFCWTDTVVLWLAAKQSVVPFTWTGGKKNFPLLFNFPSSILYYIEKLIQTRMHLGRYDGLFI